MANNETDLTLKIGGDASGAVAAADETKINVKSVSQSVADAAAGFKAMGATAVSSLVAAHRHRVPVATALESAYK